MISVEPDYLASFRDGASPGAAGLLRLVGAEAAERLRILQALSRDEVQGYYIARPTPAEQVGTLLARRWLLPQNAMSQNAIATRA